MSEWGANFLRDFVGLLRERGVDARHRASSGDRFETGRQFAFYEVLDLLRSQATAFDVKLEEIGLSQFDLEYDILGKPNNNLNSRN
jgi:hypothetical protein